MNNITCVWCVCGVCVCVSVIVCTYVRMYVRMYVHMYHLLSSQRGWVCTYTYLHGYKRMRREDSQCWEHVLKRETKEYLLMPAASLSHTHLPTRSGVQLSMLHAYGNKDTSNISNHTWLGGGVWSHRDTET